LNKKEIHKFTSLYERVRKKVDLKLTVSLRNRKPVSLYEPVSYILNSGGKRLRPILVLFSAKAVGGKFSSAYNASAAVELLHNFTLVHDDIMDNASNEKGHATLHVKYDLNTAVLSGDSLLSVAYEFLLKDVKKAGMLKKLYQSLPRVLVEVCEGQAWIKYLKLEKVCTINDYILMIRKKTAEMLIMCCRIGGIIGNGSEMR
jgi:geranylgeranyl diphosphate synthase, type II